MALNRLAKAAFAALLGITPLWMVGPVEAAGTTPLALQQKVDINGQPIVCQLNFFVAGTTSTRQTAFADFGLTQALPNPLGCDQTGMIPMHWLADGLIHIQLLDAAGVPLVDTTLQVLGPSSGGGGGGSTVDPTTILATGDEKSRYGTGPLTGFVRENGLTLGNATSGATERANADAQNLFVYLYTTDANLVVSGGRTGNALNDFNASKQLTLPDMRGRVNGYLADMGNSATTVLTATFCGSPTVLGFACGNQSTTLLNVNLPPYTPTGAVNVSIQGAYAITGFTTGSPVTTSAADGINNSGANNANIGTFVGNAQGGTSTPFGAVQPMMLKTLYLKL